MKQTIMLQITIFCNLYNIDVTKRVFFSETFGEVCPHEKIKKEHAPCFKGSTLYSQCFSTVSTEFNSIDVINNERR